jgi:hypothetical protein
MNGVLADIGSVAVVQANESARLGDLDDLHRVHLLASIVDQGIPPCRRLRDVFDVAPEFGAGSLDRWTGVVV